MMLFVLALSMPLEPAVTIIDDGVEVSAPPPVVHSFSWMGIFRFLSKNLRANAAPLPLGGVLTPSPSPAMGGSGRAPDLLRLCLHSGAPRPNLSEFEKELLVVASELRMPWLRPSCIFGSDGFEVTCTGESLCRAWNHKSLRILPSLRSSRSICEEQLRPSPELIDDPDSVRQRDPAMVS